MKSIYDPVFITICFSLGKECTHTHGDYALNLWSRDSDINILPNCIADTLDRHTKSRCTRKKLHNITTQSRYISGAFLLDLKLSLCVIRHEFRHAPVPVQYGCVSRYEALANSRISTPNLQMSIHYLHTWCTMLTQRSRAKVEKCLHIPNAPSACAVAVLPGQYV